MATKEEAARYLCDAAPEQCFWVNNGPILKNMEELASAIESISDDAYHYHANNDKNDFSKWVSEIIGDQKLANDLLSSKNRESAVKKVKARLNSLKKKAG